MKKLLLTLAALALTLCPTWANDAPPPPPPGAGAVSENTPAPTTPQEGQQTPAPKSRKEEDEQAKDDDQDEGFFANLFATRARRKAAAAEKQMDALQLRLDEEVAENEKLRGEVESLWTTLRGLDEELPAIEAALVAGKHDAPALQTPFGKKVTGLFAKAKASADLASGHPPRKLSGPGSDKADTGRNSNGAKDDRNSNQLIAAHWAERGVTFPGLRPN